MTIIECMYCGKEIVFSDKHLSKNGKHIPLDKDLAGEILGPHICHERQQQYYINRQKNAKYYPCRKCSDLIYFDEKQKTDKGKWIPIDMNTAAPHLCIQR